MILKENLELIFSPTFLRLLTPKDMEMTRISECLNNMKFVCDLCYEKNGMVDLKKSSININKLKDHMCKAHIFIYNDVALQKIKNYNIFIRLYTNYRNILKKLYKITITIINSNNMTFMEKLYRTENYIRLLCNKQSMMTAIGW